MTKDQATKRPWHYIEGGVAYDTDFHGIKAKGVICRCLNDNKEADARLIVRAVNEYDSNQETIKALKSDVDKVCNLNYELVEALIELIPEAEYALECAEMSDGESEDLENIKDKINKAKQSLAKTQAEECKGNKIAGAI